MDVNLFTQRTLFQELMNVEIYKLEIHEDIDNKTIFPDSDLLNRIEKLDKTILFVTKGYFRGALARGRAQIPWGYV